ncbi:hypothetical protein RYX36_024947 [Vicia faba]
MDHEVRSRFSLDRDSGIVSMKLKSGDMGERWPAASLLSVLEQGNYVGVKRKPIKVDNIQKHDNSSKHSQSI